MHVSILRLYFKKKRRGQRKTAKQKADNPIVLNWDEDRLIFFSFILNSIKLKQIAQIIFILWTKFVLIVFERITKFVYMNN